MKKTTSILVAFYIFSSLAYSQAFKVEGTLSYYAVKDSLFKDLYGSGALMFGGCVAYDVLPGLELRGEVSYFKDKGTMTLTDETIELSLVPLVLGLRYKGLDFDNFALFLGAGFGSYRYKETARIGDTSGSTLGYHAEGGMYIFLSRKIHFDVFVRYVKASAEPYDEKIELGGLNAGIGVGYVF
jgi:hypothetical protein